MAFAIASLCSMLPWLLAEQVGLPHVDGAEGLVDGEHDGEPDGRLGCGQHDHEDREHLPGDLSWALHVMIEGDEVHVGGVEYQLDAYEDPVRVASADLFFFQAEDGIRDLIVTGVQTCALPI